MGRLFKSVAFAAAVFAFSSLHADAEPAHEARYTIQITGFVPVICRATLGEDMVSGDEGILDLGELSEFCNDAGGYQVWFDSAPGMTGMLYVDGEEIPLSGTGATLISTSATAARRTKHLALDMGANEGGADMPPSLSIRVVAL